MKKTILIGFIFFSLLVLSSFAVNAPQVYINNLMLDEKYNAGDIVNLKLEISNSEDYPVLGYLVFSLVDSEENIVKEENLVNVNLENKEMQTFEKALKIPASAKSGDYRLDVYYKSARQDYVGYAYISYGGASKNLQIENSAEFNDVKIITGKTFVCQDTCNEGAYGPTLTPQTPASFKISLLNSKTSEAKIDLKIKIYEWDDTIGFPVDEVSQEILLSSGEEKEVSVPFNVPSKPTAYAVKIEAALDNEAVASYKNRFVVKGKSARIRDLHLSKAFFDAGEKAVLHLEASSSADGETEFGNGKIVYTILNKDAQKIDLYEEPFSFTDSSYVSDFNFDVARALGTYTVSAKILNNDGSLVDEFSYEVSPQMFTGAKKIHVLVSNDPIFKEIPRSFSEGLPLYVKADLLDRNNKLVGGKATLYINSDGLNLGPYEFDQNYALEDALPSGIYSFVVKSDSLEGSKQVVISGLEKPTYDIGVNWLGISLICAFVLILLSIIIVKKMTVKRK